MDSNQPSKGGTDDDVLAGYLHIHLVAASSGERLFEQSVKTWNGTGLEEQLTRMTADVAADKESLETISHELGLHMPAYKEAAAWVGAQASKLGPLNPLHRRGGLGSQLELEALLSAVTGKSLLWKTLLTLAQEDQRIDKDRVGALLERAQRQIAGLDEMLRATVPERFRVSDH
ncbi:hypothetical protein [Paenarthrobacter sp. PH39-S1]|uniref:hypothetical protein n=1 Tax=Micrococcaceae TaxID=1268 RepID=UPI0024BA1854|nr:hypothetical protein [Paenarthrobacter sp. PH39-S1]MDJ0357030.1 hypothetical protein [Paenarthrobacter sp. PH39-S1]